MKNGRTGSNYVEPPDENRLEGYKTDHTDAGSKRCAGRQNDDLKCGHTGFSDTESAESWRYPEVENCAGDSIPERAEPQTLFLPDVISMTKYFCDHYKLAMYSHLNHCLRDGSLARTVGFSFWYTKKQMDKDQKPEEER